MATVGVGVGPGETSALVVGGALEVGTGDDTGVDTLVEVGAGVGGVDVGVTPGD